MSRFLLATLGVAGVCALLAGVALQERAGRSPAALLATGGRQMLYGYYPYPAAYPYGGAEPLRCPQPADCCTPIGRASVRAGPDGRSVPVSRRASRLPLRGGLLRRLVPVRRRLRRLRRRLPRLPVRRRLR